MPSSSAYGCARGAPYVLAAAVAIQCACGCGRRRRKEKQKNKRRRVRKNAAKYGVGRLRVRATPTKGGGTHRPSARHGGPSGRLGRPLIPLVAGSERTKGRGFPEKGRGGGLCVHGGSPAWTRGRAKDGRRLLCVLRLRRPRRRRPVDSAGSEGGVGACGWGQSACEVTHRARLVAPSACPVPAF